MPDPATTSMLNILVPVIVGGAIALAGGLIGPPFLYHLQQKAEKKRKRTEKFEELVAAVVEHYHWFAVMRLFFISGQGIQPPLSPIIKIETIVSLYFPEFEDFVRQLDSASNNYEIWILDTGQKRIRNEPGYERLIGHDDVLTKYTYARKAFLEELRSFARREFQ